MTRARTSFAAALLAAALLAAAAAPVARAASVVVQRVRSLGGERQSAWLSVLDDQGAPVKGLDAGDFKVELDGRAVDDLEVAAFEDRYDGLALEVLIDSELLRGEGATAGERGIAALGRALTDRDRLRLVALSRPSRFEAGSGADAPALLDRLRGHEGGTADHRFYDALFDALRRAGSAGPRRSAHLLIVLASEEEGSRRGVVHVQVRSRLTGEGVPVSVLLVGEQAGGAERGRLASLVARTGGTFRALDGRDDLPAALAHVAARMRSAYRLAYRVREQEPGEGRHALSATVALPGGSRQHRFEFDAEDAGGGSGWSGALPWVGTVGVTLLLAGAFWALARRRRFRLVVASGPERGCSYDVFGLPVTIGAAEGNDLVFVDAWVSRNHAIIERRGSAVELVDQNSENGTYVNGNRVTRSRLSPGDKIDLGGAVMLTYQGPG